MDVLCFKAGIQKLSWPITFGGGVDARAHTAQVSAMGRSVENSCVATTTPTPQRTTSSSRFSFAFPLRSLWKGWRKGNEGIALDDAVVVEDAEGEEISAKMCDSKRSEESWVLKILQVRSLWAAEREEKRITDDEGESSVCCDCDEEEEETVEFDRDSFSRLLKRVSLADARFYARMSYLGNLAYDIDKIKPQHLLKHHGLRFITSSVEKKAQSFQAEKENGSAQVQEIEKKAEELIEKNEQKKKSRYQISASAAYDIAASAASYVQSHTSDILSFKTSKDGKSGDLLEGGSEASDNEARGSEVACFVATTNSVTAVVAAKEETKQAVVKDLNSARSSPCEWFISDDDQSKTRFFVIQGSESLASWQANLLFEPIQFEGLDVLVHRGIYEAAKGIYEQMLPEVHAHLKAHCDSATLCFTGHSLGGSLALLVNLMLLIRGEVPRSSLLPVIMFGAPLIMCGGDRLLRRLGLPRNHVQAITMHRDIVPRVFSCNYPYHVAELLKAINGNFRNHPCLTNQKRLYSPMGELLILQPEENFSPHHHLLPSGSGLYVLSGVTADSVNLEKHLQAAQAMFFNSPHPLEILSDRSAYGSDGTIYRDHDMNSYLKSVLGVIRLELNRMRKAKRESRREVWWPLISPQGIHAKINIGRRAVSSNLTQSKLSVEGIFHTGRESMRQLSSLVASQHVHLPMLLLFGAWAEISFR